MQYFARECKMALTQIVHSQNGSAGDHSTLVQRTFKFLNQKSTADHDKMSEDEKYNPFITKDG